jgi:filamentous hemagglutinin
MLLEGRALSQGGDIRTQGLLTAAFSDGLVTAPGSLTAAAGGLALEAATASLGGSLVSDGSLGLETAGAMALEADGLVHAEDHLSLTSASGGLTLGGTAQGGNGLTASIAGPMTVAAGGQLVSGGTATITAASVSTAGRIASGGAMTLSGGPITNDGTIESGGPMDVSTSGATLRNRGRLESAGGVIVATGALVNETGGALLAGGLFQGTATSLANAGRLEGRDGIRLTVTDAFTQSGGGATASGGAITLAADSLDLSGTLSALGALSLSFAGAATLRAGASASAGGAASLGAASVDSAGALASGGGDLSVSSGGILRNRAGAGLKAEGGGLTASAGGTLDNQGRLWGDSFLTAQAGGALLHPAGASIGSNGPTTLRSGQAFTNAGGLTVGGSLSLTAPGLVNPGVLLSRGAMSLDGLQDLDNTGLIFGGDGLDIRLSGTLTNREASLISGGDLSITGPGGTMTGAIENLSGVIESAGDMTLRAGRIENRTLHDGILETDGPTVRYDIWPATLHIVDGEGASFQYWIGHPFFFDPLLNAGVISSYPVNAILNTMWSVNWEVWVYPPGPIKEDQVAYGPIKTDWPGHGPMCSIFDPSHCAGIDTGRYGVGWARSYISESTPANAKAKGRIVAGGSMDVSAESLHNNLAAIRAEGNLRLTAGLLKNTGVAAGRRHMVEGTWYGGATANGWNTLRTLTTFDVVTEGGDYSATISAGGKLSGTIRDSIDNQSIFELGPAAGLDRSPLSDLRQHPITAADGDIDFLSLIADRAIDASLSGAGASALASITAPGSAAPVAPGAFGGTRTGALTVSRPAGPSLAPGLGTVTPGGAISPSGWQRTGASVMPTGYTATDTTGRHLVPRLPSAPGADLLAARDLEPPPPAAVYDPGLPLERLSSDTLHLPPALKPVLSTRGGLNVDAVEAGLAKTVTGFRSLFTRAPPATKALFETRFDYTDLGTFYGSDYFLSRVGGAGFSPESLPKRLGDAFLETRLVRQAILDKTGERYLSPDITNDGDQMRRLMDQAVEAGRSLDLTPGVALSAAQLAALDRDILWYVETVVDGQRVLAPRLYLAEASRGRLTRTGALITGASVDLEVTDGALTNSGAIIARDGDLRLSARDGITGTAGRLEAGRDVLLSSSDGAIALANESIEHTDALFTRTVRLGQGTVAAGRDLIIDGTAGVALTGVDLTAGRDLGLVSGAGSITVDPEAIRQTATNGWRDIRRIDGSRLSAGGELFFSAARDISLNAAELSADGGMALSTLLGDITLDAALERDYTHVSSKKYTYTHDARSHRVTTLEAGGDVTLDAGGSLGLRGARLAGKAVTLRARTGGIALQAVTDSVFEQTIKTKSGPVFTSSSDSGRYDETVRMVEIAARGPLTVESALGVAAEVVDAGGSLEASLDVLASRPGLEWVAQVRARDDIAWSAIAEAHRAWDYRSQGLSPAAAMVISIAVAVATQGMGAQLLGLAGSTTAGAGTAGAATVAGAGAGAAAGAGAGAAASSLSLGAVMANAGFSSLASQAAVAFVGNRGDLGATFRQLASADTLRGLAVAVASAGLTKAATDAYRSSLAEAASEAADGVTSGASQATNAAAGGSHAAAKGLTFGQRLTEASLQAAAATAVDATIGGRDFDEALRANLISAATTTIGAELAGEIGEAAREAIATNAAPAEMTRLSQFIAHAALGCGMGAATGGDDGCASGAGGAVVGELVGMAVAGEIEARIDAAVAPKLDDVLRWKAQGVDLARLSGALAAAIAGGDAAVAAGTAANAAEHNALLTLSALLATTLYVMYAGDGDALAGLEKIGGGEDPLSKAMAGATAEAVLLSYEAYPDETGAVLQVLAGADAAVEATVTYIDQATGNHVSRAWSSLPESTRNQIKGGIGVLSIALPAASVSSLARMTKLSKAAGVARDRAALPDSTDLSAGAARAPPDAVRAPKISIRQHYAHHDEMVQDVRSQYEAAGYRLSNREVTFRDACGTGRCRPDLVLQAPDGTYRIIEVKTGNADLSIRQSEIFPQIKDGNAIPTGKVARGFGFKPGVPLKDQGHPHGIPIEVHRFPGAPS